MINRWPARPGVASIALLSIVVITAAWWALALWPAGAVEPEWLLRTRAVCFGSMPGGLPDAGGWIVLIGEPLGMLGVLLAVWGRALRDDVRRMFADWRWRPVMLGLAFAIVLGVVKTGAHVAFVAGLGQTAIVSQSGMPMAVDIDVTSHELIDQHGRRTSLADFRGTPVILTFAFGHCATVCPVVVHDVRAARVAVNRADVPVVVITLDPWRDTPEHLSMIASAWELGPADRVLSGSVESVTRVLDALGVQRRRDERTGDIEHMSAVMATDARGHVAWRLDGGWGRVGELFAAIPASDGPH
ncbi:MAG: SCO family protein [Gemmatimonadaceae bacterium]|nr:SCO family protein [Gemmatimonadaceae bacterium]